MQPGGGLVSDSYKVTLLTLNGPQNSIFSDSQGWFEFSDLVPGNYEVQVETNGSDLEIISQSVAVFRGAPSFVTVSLREKKNSSTAKATSVSLSEFAGDVPKAARREFELATKAAAASKTDEAIARLRKALAIFPNFVMARSDLGAQLLAQGKLEEAAEQLREAIRIDDKAFNPKLNLGIVLVQQHNFSEAAAVLERAISLNPESAAARLYAGLANMGLGNMNQAEKELKVAHSIGGISYSLALFHLGQLYVSKGERESALQMFERYLRDSPDAANAAQVRKMIALLR